MVKQINENDKENQYNNRGLSFNVSVVGSTSNPRVSNTTIPSNTSPIISDIQTSKGDSFPFNFIQARPRSISTTPAPVLTFSFETALIPNSTANFSGTTVRLAPVSTNALTNLECFFSKLDNSISTVVCPIQDYNNKDYINISDTKIINGGKIGNNKDFPQEKQVPNIYK